jgi:SAM-dependent methyltransferase
VSKHTVATSLIFDRQLLRQRRSRLNPTIITQNRLYQYLQTQLNTRLKFIKRDFSRILILGDGDVDISDCFKKETLWQFSLTGKTSRVLLDDEFLPFADAQFDLIISFMEMHYFNDIPGFLQQIKRCLIPDGLFLGVFLGQDTLWQLRQVTQVIEEEIYGGVSPRVAPMVKLSDAAALMQRAGFALPVIDTDHIDMIYNNATTFIHELKNMGLSNVMIERNNRMAERRFLQRLMEYYDHHYHENNGVIASFTAVYLSGWTTATTQPKALPRGSATVRLAEFL